MRKGPVLPELHELPLCGECRRITVRVFEELLVGGADEESALRAAYRVLSLRHPERKAAAIAAAVDSWISETKTR